MGETIEESVKFLLSLFPGLEKDSNFKITSKKDPVYNCIAWAYGITKRWMWPNTGYTRFLDGVDYWPTDKIMDENVLNFINIFKDKGYEKCKSDCFEDGYRKIALYVKENTNDCTHASKQLSNGFWSSKIGKFHDIQHGTPYSIEGKKYGVVYCIMKKKLQ